MAVAARRSRVRRAEGPDGGRVAGPGVPPRAAYGRSKVGGRRRRKWRPATAFPKWPAAGLSMPDSRFTPPGRNRNPPAGTGLCQDRWLAVYALEVSRPASPDAWSYACGLQVTLVGARCGMGCCGAREWRPGNG